MLSPNVMIRLDVEAIRYQVIHAFSTHSKEVEGEIDRAVVAAIKEFDFTAIVKQETEAVLRQSIKSAISCMVAETLSQDPLRDLIKTGAAKKVREAIETILA